MFLISDESRYISGAEIVVDGGFSNQAGVKTSQTVVRDVYTPEHVTLYAILELWLARVRTKSA